ncbi:MAG: hypothetical protein ACREJ4_00200 [Candidatus Methylomirabilaceae bacterium]
MALWAGIDQDQAVQPAGFEANGIREEPELVLGIAELDAHLDGRRGGAGPPFLSA